MNGAHLNIPLSCRNQPVKYGSQGWDGTGWAAWGKKKKSVVNAQLKMNIRREINVAYERFPSYLKTESLTSYSG